ncbi:RusA-like resolvase [Gordonia phage Gudmit]|nr:RusA-like resolvase [Gordonia phage Gudmit]
MIHVLELPYSKPPLTLNPRGVGMTRGAAFARARLIRDVRADAHRLALGGRLPRKVAHVRVQLHYRPRDNRHRDPINLTATQKALVDGLRDYGLVADDDSRYVTDLMPIIHRAEKGQPGRMWLELDIDEPAHCLVCHTTNPPERREGCGPDCLTDQEESTDE